MTKPKYPYPYIDCDGEKRLGIMACDHVLSGAVTTSHYVPASDKDIGEALCQDCARVLSEDRAEDIWGILHVVCVECFFRNHPGAVAN